MTGIPRPKKSLGQNFLIDPNYKRKILDAVLETNDRAVLEIGGGRGMLTEGLAKRASRLCVVEKDRHLAESLRVKFRDIPGIEILCEDFLKLDFDSILIATRNGSTSSPCPNLDTLSLSKGEPLIVVGNLPYNVASQIFIKLIKNRKLFSELFLMFQKEMALRFVAKPRTKDYGLLTLWAQIYTDPKILFHLPPTAFSPRPKVSSSFVHFRIKETPLISDKEAAGFWKLMRLLFQKRRKTIRSALHQAGKNLQLECIDAPLLNKRAEELSLGELIGMRHPHRANE